MCPRLVLRVLFSLSLLVTFAFASDLKIKVLDPQSARVAGARISLARNADHAIVAVRTTDARGEAVAGNLASADYTMEVLAPGFAAGRKSVSIPAESGVELKLSILAAPE